MGWNGWLKQRVEKKRQQQKGDYAYHQTESGTCVFVKGWALTCIDLLGY